MESYREWEIRHIKRFLESKGYQIDKLIVNYYSDDPLINEEERVTFVNREPIQPIPEEAWKDLSEIGSEPDLLRIKVFIKKHYSDENKLDYKQLWIDLYQCLNKAANGNWPSDNKDYSVENTEYNTEDWYSCWHHRQVQFQTYSDGVAVQMYAGLCYCS